MGRLLTSLAELVTTTTADRLPPTCVERFSSAFVDCVGVTLAGYGEDGPRALRRAVARTEGAGDSHVVGGPEQMSTIGAALVNGCAAHALDFDDLHHPWYGHPSAVLVPVVLGLGAQCRADGRDAAAAYSAGLAAGHAIALVINLEHYRRGWHATSTIGSLAAACAAAALLKLDQGQVENALGIAASQAGGLRQNFGTMTKPLHAGLAARNGILAAGLAAEGFEASPDALDGSGGYVHMFSGNDINDEVGLEAFLDDPYQTAYDGLATKLHPSCGATHPAITAALELRAQDPVRSSRAEEVVCDVNPLALDILTHPRPDTGLQAKFSLEYCIAVALLDGVVGLEQFSEQRVRADDVQTLLRRVRAVPDPTIDPAGEFGVRLLLRGADGTTAERSVALAPGKHGRPLDRSTVGTKFLACASPVLGDGPAREALSRSDRIAEIDDISRLLPYLQPPVEA